MSHRVSAVHLLVILALFVAACQPAQPAPSKPAAPAPPAAAPAAATGPTTTAAPAKEAAKPAATSGQPTRVSVAITDPMDSQDPYVHSNTVLYPFFCEVLGCLVGWDAARAEPIPELAESWKVENPTTWVFTLRKGVRWHDGSPFTSADVISSLTMARDHPKTRQKDRLANVKSFEAVDDYTVKLVTNEPDAELLDAVFTMGIAMTSKKQLDSGVDLGTTLAVGTGPYVLKEWIRNQRVVVAKNPSWWKGPVEGPDEVVYSVIREEAPRITALLNNEVQIAMQVSPHDVERINASPNASVMVGDSLTIMFLGMNPTYAPWENKNLRKAVAYAIDRDSIIKNIILGYADRLDAPIGPGQYGYDPNFPQTYTYDPAKAKEYMVQAGFPDGVDVEFTTTVGTYTKDKEISEAMLPMLAAVGIRAKLLTPEAATRTTMLFDGKLSLFYQGRGQVRDPGKPLSQYFETGVTKRLTYSNPQVDALFKQERAAFNPDERKKLLNQIMNQLVEDVPAHWLWRYKLLWGVSKSVDWKPRADEAIMANEIRVK